MPSFSYLKIELSSSLTFAGETLLDWVWLFKFPKNFPWQLRKSVPVRYALITGTVPVRYALFTGTVPVNNLFLFALAGIFI